MSGMGSIAGELENFFSGGGSAIDVGKIEDLVEAIITVAPAIEKGLVAAAPYVEAIVGMIKNGGTPSDDDWAALKARLDAGSAALQAAAQQAQAEPAEPPADAPANPTK